MKARAAMEITQFFLKKLNKTCTIEPFDHQESKKRRGVVKIKIWGWYNPSLVQRRPEGKK